MERRLITDYMYSIQKENWFEPIFCLVESFGTVEANLSYGNVVSCIHSSSVISKVEISKSN